MDILMKFVHNIYIQIKFFSSIWRRVKMLNWKKKY